MSAPLRGAALGATLLALLATIFAAPAAAQDAAPVTAAVEAEAGEAGEAAGEEPPPDDRGEDIVASLGDAVEDLGQAMGDRGARARIQWDPSWPRYRFDELVLTLGMGIVIALAEFLPTRSESNWAGVSALDLEVQQGLGLDNPADRSAAEIVSDVFVSALVLWPVLGDSLLYAGAGEGAWDVAWQLSLISLEVFAINHALNIGLKLLSRRERPIGHYCENRPGYDADPVCADPPPAESFWSGHVSNAFAGAALICLHHDVLDLFGDEGSDGAMCGSALALAATTGLLRIMSDRHWVTDVMTGALVGSAIGILVPWLLHYQGGGRPPLSGTSAPPIALAPMVGDETLGVSAFGLW